MINGEVYDAMQSVSVTVIAIGAKSICFESDSENVRKWIPIVSYSSMDYSASGSDWTVGEKTSVPVQKWNRY